MTRQQTRTVKAQAAVVAILTEMGSLEAVMQAQALEMVGTAAGTWRVWVMREPAARGRQGVSLHCDRPRPESLLRQRTNFRGVSPGF